MTPEAELRSGRYRLPIWNEYAYLRVPEEGPWAYLYDVNAGVGGGEPIPMLIGECQQATAWERIGD